jgi:pimeloyl-ACP methyl ester carboxylesterase
MHPELISIATDTEPLDGAFYVPADGRVKAAALLFHGNCGNFYTGPSRFLPEVLVPRGIACLAFNRRGHDMVASSKERAATGGSFQLASEGIADNRFASDWLGSRGFKNPIVIGHSNGGMLAAQHCADNHGNPRALVLMSAHGGGENLAEHSNKGGLFACDRQTELLAQAEAMVAEGHGRDLMLLAGWWWVITAESFLDRTRNTPDTVKNASRIRCPSLYFRGDKEVAAAYPAEAFAKNAGAPCDVRILSNCDHWYTGQENDVAVQVADWLDARCGFC